MVAATTDSDRELDYLDALKEWLFDAALPIVLVSIDRSDQAEAWVHMLTRRTIASARSCRAAFRDQIPFFRFDGDSRPYLIVEYVIDLLCAWQRDQLTYNRYMWETYAINALKIASYSMLQDERTWESMGMCPDMLKRVCAS